MMESIEKLREWSRWLDGAYASEDGGHYYVYNYQLTSSMKSCGELMREQCDEIEREIESRYMELPVDADGAPIRCGDEVTADTLGNGRWSVFAVASDYWVDVDGYTHKPCATRHVKPRTLEDIITEYEELAANQNVKDYFEVSKELRTIQSEQFMDEPELELYKEVNGYKLYIELPYDELWIMTDKVEVKHHSYSYRYERPNGSTVMSCSSLCGYPREWAIERLDEEIEEIRKLMEARDD